MSIEIKIPEVGESITEVQISEWLKSEGDTVKADESVAVIDSEKTTLELPAPQAGRLVKILHKAGDTVRVGEVVAEIEPVGATAKANPPETKEPAKAMPESGRAEKPVGEKKAAGKAVESVAKKTGGANGSTATARKEKTESVRVETPAAPESARETQEAAPVAGRSAATPPVAAVSSDAGADQLEEEVVPMTMLRRTVARRLVEAQQAMAMLTTFNDVDMSAVMALRKEYGEAFEKRHQVRLGFMSFFVKAAIDALKQYPKLNAEIRRNDIVYRNYFDIGVAISSERGLVVPVLRRAERLSIADLEKSIGNFAQSSRSGKLKPADLEGGTFTITNGGVFGSLLSTPIINPPQTGILGMHTIQERPVAVNGQVVIRPMMYLALTYDHRLVDGREAVLFLRRVKEAVENPARMLIEI